MISQKPYSSFYKWELIILLWFAMFFHQADRQLFNVLLPLIRESLSLSDEQLGLVASILIATYAVLVPVAGYAGDVISKKKIVFLSLFCWSTATLFTGSSTVLFHLILLRGIATGGGEAFYAPAAFSLIGEYHKKYRAFAMSIHQTALYAGIILSGLIGGYIGETYGWRSAFYLFGGFGIALAFVIIVRMRDPRRHVPEVKSAKNDQSDGISFLQAIQVLFKTPTALFLTLAFALMVFVNVGYLTWMPTYLFEEFNLSITEAGFSSMFYHHIAAFAGVIVGGKLTDKLATKNPRARLIAQSLSFFLGAPFIFWMGSATNIFTVYLAMALFGFFRGIYDSNIFAALYEVIEPKYRSSASGVMLMFAFLTGAFAPYLLGAYKSSLGLSFGFSFLALFYLLASLSIFIGAKFFFHKDQHKET